MKPTAATSCQRRALTWALSCLLLVTLVAWYEAPAVAHDPSAWGGLYRTRDGGATWFLANEGRFVTAALDIAVDPIDPARLLLATDSGLLRSDNGGRDWEVVDSDLLRGAVFAVAVSPDGGRAIASTGSAIVVTDARGHGGWRAVQAPSGAAPARQIVVGAQPGQVYIAGGDGLLRSDDWGDTWRPTGDGLPSAIVSRLVSLPARADGPARLVAVSGGALWLSDDGAQTWRQRADLLPPVRIDTVVADGRMAGRLWAGGGGRVFLSDDAGLSWRPIGSPLDEQNTPIHGIGADLDVQSLVLTTERGLYRSGDGGMTWDLLADGVPVHLPARPLTRDLGGDGTLYAGFSIRPYESIWQSAAEGTTTLQRLDAVNVGGGLAFLTLVTLGGGVVLARLRRFYDAPMPGSGLTSGWDDAGPSAAEAPGSRTPAREPLTEAAR